MRFVVKRVSLSDVARAAGVAKATASRALSGREDVGAATRARIVDIATDLGYQPHRVAQALRTGRFGVLAISIPLEDARAGEIIRTAALRAAHHGYQMIIDADRGEDDQARAALLENMSVDGVLLIGRTESVGERPAAMVASLEGDAASIVSEIDALVARIRESVDPAPAF